MYTSIKYLIFCFLMAVLSACSNDFLTIYPETSSNEGNFYNTEEEFIELANGCYTPMRNYYRNYWVLAEMKSDNTSFQNHTVAGSASRGWDAVDMFLPASSYTIYSNFWDASYNGINRCNKLLEKIKESDIHWSDEAYKSRCTGEALFLRALYYFNLVREFGDVPLVQNTLSSEDAARTGRTAVDSVYAAIISDLKNASSNFKEAEGVAENGRASWGASASLLGEVYLTLHQYAEAEQQLRSVIDAGKYSLLSDYGDLFDPSKKDFTETIFSIQYAESLDELSNNFIFQFAPWTSGGDVTKRSNISIKTSGGWNQPTSDLIAAFTPGDQRKAVAIGFWEGEDWDSQVKAIPYCAKYKPPISAPDDRCGDNFPVIRYAGVLLMYAEVLNDMGKTGDAINYIEKVRFRAGLTDPLTGYNKEKLDSLIDKERQKELCFENHRWYYLKRTGKAVEVMTANGKREMQEKSYLAEGAYQVDAYKLLDPIPSREIEVNGLKQNAGY